MSTESNWPVPQRPMGFLEIYVSAGRLVARTAVRGLGAALVLIVPAYLLLGAAMSAFFIDLARIVARHGSSDLSTLTPQALGDVAGSFAFAGLVGLIVVLASSVAQLATTIESWDRALLVERSIGDWLRRLFGRPLAMTIAQIVVLMMMVIMIMFAYMLVAAILVGAAGDGGSDIALFLMIAALAYIAIATIFRLHETVADDRGPWRSLLSSMALTRGRWLRLFAALSIPVAIYFAASELITPAIGEIDLEDPASVAAGYRAIATTFTPTRSLLIGALSALTQFLLVNLVTALYIDLRARRGDFDYDEAEEIEAAME